MAHGHALQHPWARRRKRGLRALPLRLLALGSLGLVVAAAWGLARQWELRGATVPKVAALAAGLPQERAPKALDGMPGVLDRAVDTIAFPDLTGLGWRPLGARRDEIAGRAAVTVYYGRRGREVRYTIVSGSGGVDDAKALGQTVTWGARVWTFVTGVPDTMTLVFKREERTVVLTAPRADATFRRTMLRLASFRAGGRLAA